MKKLAIAFLVLVVCYLAGGVYLLVEQRSFIYFPTPDYPHSYPVEEFSNQGEIIEVLVLNPGKEHALLYFGGNAESVVHSADNYQQAFPEKSLYLVNYRGFGGSTGEPTEQGLYSDAEHIFDAIKDRHLSIAVIGRSLGSGVASYMASVREIERLVLVTPYDSIQRLAKDQYPMYPISLLLKDQYDSIARVPEIESSVLVILSEIDLVVPKDHSVRLIERFAAEQVQVEIVADADHGTVVERANYYRLINDFLSTDKHAD